MSPHLPTWRLPLRAWQREAFETWSAARPADALVVATPGAGKTRFATRLAHALLAERSVSRAIVVVPREHLKAQVARAMAGAAIALDDRFRNSDGALPSDVDGAVVTYQQVAAAPRAFRALCGPPTLVVLDEIHHAGEEASWGQALRDAFDGARHRVSLSGTPFRSDGTALPFVDYAAGECVAQTSYDYARALADGVCRALVFPLHGGEAEWVSHDGGEMRATFDTPLGRRHAGERLRTALTQADWLGDVLARAHVRLCELRAAGHREAGGLVAAMNQEHARFVARVLEARTGVRPDVVVSDLEDASQRIASFARSSAPWIVAVHMISEGVDIPRLRVGVFASNVVSELYFRQFCGRFVRAGGDGPAGREAYVYLPDDPRLRAMAAAITDDVRRALRDRPDRADGPAADGRLPERPEPGAYTSIAATAQAGRVLDFGPLFNPAAYLAAADESPGDAASEPVAEATHAERRHELRQIVRGLVARTSAVFSVDHRLVHATLNDRCGGPIATATLAALERRRRLLETWLERRSYEGMK